MNEDEFRSTNDERVKVSDGRVQEGWKRFTAYIQYKYEEGDTSIEEIDLDVRDSTPTSVIKSAVRFVLDRDYDKGGKIVGLEERFGFYI